MPWPVRVALLSILLGVAVLIAGGATHEATRAVGNAPPGAWRPLRSRPPVADSVIELAVQRALFRASRRAADVPFDPVGAADSVPASAPQASRPPVRVSGIVWGAQPVAVVEGIPGLDAPRAMRSGEMVNGFVVKRITQSQVTLSGMDTVWSLSPRTAH